MHFIIVDAPNFTGMLQITASTPLNNILNNKTYILTCYGYTKFCITAYMNSCPTITKPVWPTDHFLSECAKSITAKTMHTPGCNLLNWMLIKHRALNFHLFLNRINLKEKRSSTEDEHLKETNWQRWLEMQSNQTKLCKFYFTEDSTCANVSSDLLSDHLTGNLRRADSPCWGTPSWPEWSTA